MSKESNNNGRAYEYICLMTLFNDISKNCKVRIIENSSFASSKKAWNSIEKNMQNLRKKLRIMMQKLQQRNPKIQKQIKRLVRKQQHILQNPLMV